MDTAKTHTETIDTIGTFTWRIPRTMRDEIRIGAEVSRLTEGIDAPSQWLAAVSEMVATLKVLTAESPADWNVDAMDPLDPVTYQQLSEVFGALRAAEERFRKERRKGSQAGGQRNGRDSESVVSETIQPTT